MKKYKKQHYIPQSYLESWCDPNVPGGYDEYVWMLSADGESVKRKNPKNIFYDSDTGCAWVKIPVLVHNWLTESKFLSLFIPIPDEI